MDLTSGEGKEESECTEKMGIDTVSQKPRDKSVTAYPGEQEMISFCKLAGVPEHLLSDIVKKYAGKLNWSDFNNASSGVLNSSQAAAIVKSWKDKG